MVTIDVLKYVGINEQFGKVLPPCYLRGQYTTEGRKNFSDWEQEKLQETEVCCKMFRSIFGWKNIRSIMNVMKFSVGMPAQHSLKVIKDFDAEDYNTLFPNSGNLSFLEELG